MAAPNGFTPGASIDRFHRELVEFLLTWAPYGDPPEEETMPRFGMTTAGARGRTHELVALLINAELSADDRALLVRAAELPCHQIADASTEAPSLSGRRSSQKTPQSADGDDLTWVLEGGVWRSQ